MTDAADAAVALGLQAALRQQLPPPFEQQQGAEQQQGQQQGEQQQGLLRQRTERFEPHAPLAQRHLAAPGGEQRCLGHALDGRKGGTPGGRAGRSGNDEVTLQPPQQIQQLGAVIAAQIGREQHQGAMGRLGGMAVGDG